MCECVKFPFGKAWSARHQVRFFQQFAGTIIQAHLWPCSSTHLHPVLQLPLDSHPGGILNINSIVFQDTETKSSVSRESYHRQLRIYQGPTDPWISSTGLPSTLRSIPLYNASAKSIQIFFNLAICSKFQKPTSFKNMQYQANIYI